MADPSALLGRSGNFPATGKASWLRHGLLSVSFILFYLVLNRPEVLLLSKLGFTTWYPATGLMFALMLGVSPWYAFLVFFTNSLASMTIYQQPLISWGNLAGTVGETGVYSVAAILLRGRLQINLGLSRRLDVVRYTVVVLLAAMGSTIFGVTSLLLDHTITRSELLGAQRPVGL